jgi:hypothetical protein
MDKREYKFKVTLELDKKWAGQMNYEELIEYIKYRLNSSLGLRGQIKKLKAVKK